jgi:hypothetical protein
MFAPAFADTLGDVEYQLPKDTKEWVVGNKLNDASGNPSTIVYIPAGTVRPVNAKDSGKPIAKEFFSVAVGGRYFDPNDNTLKEYLETKAYPNMNAKFIVLEKTDDGLLYEWIVKDNGQEKIHGWGRLLPTPSGSANIMYQTENSADVGRDRGLWVPVLKGVTAINPPPQNPQPAVNPTPKAPPHS